VTLLLSFFTEPGVSQQAFAYQFVDMFMSVGLSVSRYLEMQLRRWTSVLNWT